jgi:hypothetical protein
MKQLPDDYGPPRKLSPEEQKKYVKTLGWMFLCKVIDYIAVPLQKALLEVGGENAADGETS